MPHESQDTDVVIIGGGAVGVCAAHYLCKQGRDVTVVDKGRIGGGASHGNAGLVVPSHVVPLAAPGVIGQGLKWLLSRDSPFYIRLRWDRKLFSWLWQFWRSCTREHVERAAPVLCELSLASRDLFETLSGEADRDAERSAFGFAPTGLLMVNESEHGREENREEAEQARRVGLDPQVLNGDEVREVEPKVPPAVQGGVYYPQDALVEPAAFVDSLKGALEEQGASFCPHEPVTGLRRERRRVAAVETPGRELRPREVVLAAGAWTGRLARELDVPLPIQPAKGYSLTCAANGRAPRVPFILSESKVSVTPFDGRMRFGGTLALAGFDDTVDPQRVQPIREVASHYTPEAREAEEADAWVGYRPCTPDGLPVIGRPRGYDNLTLAAGHAMIGLSLSPVTGKLVSEIVEGRTPSLDIGALDPDRFR